MTAREGEQLSHQIRGPVGILLDLHNISKARIACLVAREKQITKADNRGEQIIEVMRHTTCQLTHSLHFLRLSKLHLERLLFTRIDQIGNHGGLPTRLIGITGKELRCLLYLLALFLQEPKINRPTRATR